MKILQEAIKSVFVSLSDEELNKILITCRFNLAQIPSQELWNYLEKVNKIRDRITNIQKHIERIETKLAASENEFAKDPFENLVEKALRNRSLIDHNIKIGYLEKKLQYVIQALTIYAQAIDDCAKSNFIYEKVEIFSSMRDSDLNQLLIKEIDWIMQPEKNVLKYYFIFAVKEDNKLLKKLDDERLKYLSKLVPANQSFRLEKINRALAKSNFFRNRLYDLDICTRLEYIKVNLEKYVNERNEDPAEYKTKILFVKCGFDKNFKILAANKFLQIVKDTIDRYQHRQEYPLIHAQKEFNKEDSDLILNKALKQGKLGSLFTEFKRLTKEEYTNESWNFNSSEDDYVEPGFSI